MINFYLAFEIGHSELFHDRSYQTFTYNLTLIKTFPTAHGVNGTCNHVDLLLVCQQNPPCFKVFLKLTGAYNETPRIERYTLK